MVKWNSDDELFEIAERELFTSVLGDVMDKLRLSHQFLPPQIRPLLTGKVLIGRAMPVLSGDVFEERVTDSANAMSAKSFGLMLEALDDLRKNEIYVSTGSSPRNAMWGEMMTTRAKVLGARGAVLNGYIRDTRAVTALNFPTFSLGSYGQDSGPRYKVYDFRVPVEVGGIRIESGDILVGDVDGVVVVPRRIETEVFNLAIEKARAEKQYEANLSVAPLRLPPLRSTGSCRSAPWGTRT